MNKEAVKNGFSGCFNTYVTEASVQQAIAKKLALMSQRNLISTPRIALEVGCGTGFLTYELLQRYADAIWLHNDISPTAKPYIDMLVKQHNAAGSFTVGDAELLTIPETIDFFASSSAMQWFTDISSFLDKLANSITSVGIIAFSTFGPDNLKEIKQLTGNGLAYPTYNVLNEIVSKRFEIIEMEEDHHTIYFKNPIEVLRHIKQTGVNGPFRQCWTKGKLEKFALEYKQLLTQDGYPLTYHPIYVVARPKLINEPFAI